MSSRYQHLLKTALRHALDLITGDAPTQTVRESDPLAYYTLSYTSGAKCKNVNIEFSKADRPSSIDLIAVPRIISEHGFEFGGIDAWRNTVNFYMRAKAPNVSDLVDPRTTDMVKSRELWGLALPDSQEEAF